MSQTEGELREVIREVRGEEEGALDDIGDFDSRLAQRTLPGRSNEDIIRNMKGMDRVVEAAVNDLNNWVEVIDVRLHRDLKVGIPMRYRWTIKRWVANNMDQWLMNNGWEDMPHLKADSREHEPNELEARYRKEFGDYLVHVNIYVPFTDDVFEALNNSGGMEKVEEVKRRKKAKRNIMDERRNG